MSNLRTFPIRNAARSFPRPRAQRIYPRTSTQPFVLLAGTAKPATLGERVYPFAELHVDRSVAISSIDLGIIGHAGWLVRHQVSAAEGRNLTVAGPAVGRRIASAPTPVQWVLIQVLRSNTGRILVGSTSQRILELETPLSAEAALPSITLRAVDLASVWIGSAVAGEGVNVFYSPLLGPVMQGNNPDLITATRFIPFTPDIFRSPVRFHVLVTDADGNQVLRTVHVSAGARIARDKGVKINRRFRPFSDAKIAEEGSLVAKVEYEVEGEIARQDIPRATLVTGTHDGPADSADLVDSGHDFLALGVRVGALARNDTDGSTAKVTAIATTTNANDTLELDGLAGGADNDFDAADSYTILQGGELDDVARDFETSFATAGRRILNLYVTDREGNTSKATVAVGVGG